MEIVPGILEKDWESIDYKINLIKSFAESVQIDFIDGIFSPNKTFFEFLPFEKFKNEIKLEAHLMVDEPINYIDKLAEAGFSKFVGQIEKMSDYEKFILKTKKYGKVGLALDLETPVEKIQPVLGFIDEVLVLTVRAGFSGQEFKLESLDKVKKLKNLKNDITITVDGGINNKTITEAFNAGANRFVSSSYLFDNPQENFLNLQKLVSSRI